MKQKRNLLISILLSGILGWALGFLQLPYIEKDFSFLMGLLAGLALVSLGVILLFVWNKNALLLQLIGEKQAPDQTQNPTKLHKTIWILVAAFIVVGGLVSSILIFKQNEFSKNQTLLQNKKIAEQSELLASTRKSNSLILINGIFDWIDEDLKNNPERKLSEATIARIVALNYSFEPYSYVQGDSLSQKKWSPERGQLLLMLSTVKMDSSSFHQIKNKVSFFGADLREANLSGTDLSGVDLSNANLKNADLSDANLSQADLRKTNLWGANLNKANLQNSNLMKADLSWAEMNEADLKRAVFKWANLVSAKLRAVEADSADLSWSNMEGVILSKANLNNANLEQTELVKANLSEATLTNSNLNYTNLSEANLTKVNLEGADLRKAKVHATNWFEMLKKWKVKGVEKIQDKYKIVPVENRNFKYDLEKITK